MNSWAIFTLAFAAVVIQAWVRGRGSSNWYLGCIVPLVYGGAVAWMFVGKDFTRSLQIILFGAAIPITLLVSAWLRKRDEEGQENEGEPKEQEN
ncbi:hypothetical protein H8S11_00285 [Flintibacter sp. NSJ-23]|uniref:Uncharacterized protein n=1 Tax=Flintibacter hominis TaxID=2763048 RepID=A0A8J6M617_9FIRM|nr:hypothetical protein [Flintibacter hominis]MBC5721268.1 hypothetical protein [Flintibacter hominis]